MGIKYYSHGDIRGMFENEHGKWVGRAEYDALAAENAALRNEMIYTGLTPKISQENMAALKKPFIDKLIYSSDYFSVCGFISTALNQAILSVHGDNSFIPETPTTDSALAAIQAQGVEKFAERMLTLANDPTYSTASHRNDLRDAGAKAKDYAAELVREASAIYTRYNATVDSEVGDWVDGQTLHEMQQLIEAK